MALHHRREIADMRHAYARESEGASVSVSERPCPSESDSERSYNSGSDRSYQTQPTSYSSSPRKRPLHIHHNTCDGRQRETYHRYFDDRETQQSPMSSPRGSVDTYASTVQSEEDLPDDLPEYDSPPPPPFAPSGKSSAIATTPSDFSKLFPSRRRLMVRHDDSTLDGNMNLRVDTEIGPLYEGGYYDMTLYHLRLHDLKKREFSLRRYCRDSGREVCHSVRKYQKPAAHKRPGFHRSLSNALQSIRPKSEHRSSTTPTVASLKRNDSGYASLHSVNFDDDDRPKSADDSLSQQETPPTNSIKLEFSNYAQLELKKDNSKRYDFEYWGTHYAWKRVTRKDRGYQEIAYHLTKAGHDRTLAYIVPVSTSSPQAQEDKSKGGWIPPCSMWIDDKQILSSKDVSDVVISTGLMALVDDSIRIHFHSKDSKELLIPVPKLSMGVEYIGPKRLINEMFNRKDSGSQSRPCSSGRPVSRAASTTIRRLARQSSSCY